MRRLKFISRLCAAAIALASWACAEAALAGNTWTGGGATPNWNDNNNWGGAAPAFGTLTFTSGGTQGTTSSNNSIVAMNKLLWTGTLSWALNGSTTLSLYDNGGVQAKIENQSTGLVTINDPIVFAANNNSPPNPFGEINTVSGDITFGTGALTVNGSSVNGIRLFGSGHTATFNNTVNAAGKWIGLTATNGLTVAIGGAFTSGDIYIMNGGTLALNAGGSLTASALRFGGDFGTTGQQNQTKAGTFRMADAAGGQSFGGTINPVAGNTSNALLVDLQNTSGTDTLSGPIFLDSGLTIQSNAGGALTMSGAIFDLKSQRLAFNNSGPVAVTNAITSSSNGGSLVKSSAGLLLLNGVGTYTGGTTVNAGTLRLGVSNALPTGAGSLALGGPGATLDLNGNDQTVAGFNDNGGQTTGLLTNNSTTAATFTLSDTGLDNFAGTIADGGAGKVVKLVKNGTGVFTLSGANSYSGETTINAGTLALGLGGLLGNSAVTVNANGTFSPLQGSSVGANSGSSGASLTLKSGGTLDMTSGGTGTVGTFTINSGANSFSGTALDLQGGTLKVDVSDGSVDQLVVNAGTAAVSGTNYIRVRTAVGLTSLTLGSYTLISAPHGGLAGNFQFHSGSPLNVISPSIVVNLGANSYRLSLVSTATALQLLVSDAGPKAPVTLMPMGASITEGASADNPYNGGGYRSKLYQYLANDGRFAINMAGSNTRLFENNPTAPNILTAAGQLHNEGHFGSATWQILNNLNGYDNSNTSGSNNGGYWLAPNNGVNPNYLMLNVGGNDYSANPNDPFVVDRLNQIITTVSSLRPGVTVIVSNLAWRKNPEGASIDSRYNPFVPGMVYNLVLNGYHVQFVDMYSVMSPNDSTANLSSDQIHPNQAGYNLMADTWWKSFAFGAAYWTGNQDNSWNTITADGSTNWASNYPRTIERQALLDAGTDVYFNANNVPLSTTLGADVSIRSLNFAAGASAPVAISGNNTVTLGSGGMTVQAGTGAHAISANVTIGTAQTWSNISGNPLTLNGALGGSQALRLIGPAFFNFGGVNTDSGDIAIDSGGLFLADTGNLSGQGFVYLGNGGPANAGVNASLLAANNSTPILNPIVTNKADTGSSVGAGTRVIGGTNPLGTVTFGGAIFVNGGTVLSSVAGGTTAFTNKIANGIDTGNVSRAITIAGDGTVLLAGANTYTGGTNINSGALRIGSGGSLPGTGFLFVGNGGPAFANVNATLLSGNTITPVGNAIVTNKADTGSALGSGTRTIGGANNSGTVTYAGSVFLNGGAILTATSGGTVAFTNAIANGTDTGNVSHSVTIAGNGTVQLAGNNSFSGATTVNAGTLQLDGAIAGSVTVNNTARLAGHGTINQNLNIDSGGTAQFNGGTFTVNGNITNNGLFILSNGAVLAGSQSFINNGTLDLITAGPFTPPPGFQNNGVILDASVVRVTGVTRTGNSVSITIDSYTGHVYQLQSSASLSDTSFMNIGAPQSGNTGIPLVFADSVATGSPVFYRVVVSP